MPFDTYHRNDQPETIRATARGQASVVAAETAEGHALLLTSDDLDACDGSIDRLIDALEHSAIHRGLMWTTPIGDDRSPA